MARTTSETMTLLDLDFSLSLFTGATTRPGDHRAEVGSRVVSALRVAEGQMVDASPKPKRRRKTRVSRGNTVLLILDRYRVSAGIVAGVWLVADWTGHPLTQGAQAAVGSFVAYAALKGRTDNKWRELEVEQDRMQGLVEALEKSAPGSPEALAVRRDLVALSRRAQASGSEDGP